MKTTRELTSAIDALPQEAIENYYLDPKEFRKHLVIYKSEREEAERNNLPEPFPSDDLTMFLIAIVKNLATRYNFGRYSYLDEMILDGIENCIKCVKKFDLNPRFSKRDQKVKKRSPFCYFTTITWQCFVRRLKKEEANTAAVFASYESHFSGDNEVYSDGPHRKDGFFNENLFKPIPPQLPSGSAVKDMREKGLEFMKDFDSKKYNQSTKKKPKDLDVIDTIDFDLILS